MSPQVSLTELNVYAEDIEVLVQTQFYKEPEGGAVMGVLRFVATLFFFFLLGGQGLQPGEAYADCCGCVCMPYQCTCAGQIDQLTGQLCGGWCRSADPILQTNASLGKSAEQLQPVNESAPSPFPKSDVTKQVMELTSGGKCFRNRVALRLLGNDRDTMKFEPIRFNENVHDQTLAFQVKTDKEM
jgi:hypothetical protein